MKELESATEYAHLLLAYVHLSLGDFLRTLSHTDVIMSTSCEDHVRLSCDCLLL
jgi:hypothetical protein